MRGKVYETMFIKFSFITSLFLIYHGLVARLHTNSRVTNLMNDLIFNRAKKRLFSGT